MNVASDLAIGASQLMAANIRPSMAVTEDQCQWHPLLSAGSFIPDRRRPGWCDGILPFAEPDTKAANHADQAHRMNASPQERRAR
jgi:hypothetical protein